MVTDPPVRFQCVIGKFAASAIRTVRFARVLPRKSGDLVERVVSIAGPDGRSDGNALQDLYRVVGRTGRAAVAVGFGGAAVSECRSVKKVKVVACVMTKLYSGDCRSVVAAGTRYRLQGRPGTRRGHSPLGEEQPDTREAISHSVHLDARSPVVMPCLKCPGGHGLRRTQLSKRTPVTTPNPQSVVVSRPWAQ